MSASESLAILLEEIRSHGGLTRENVVRHASDPQHPLHERFEWDDAVAGHQYRLSQAGDLIRSVKYVYGENPDGTEKTVNRYTATRLQESPHVSAYQPTIEVMKDPLQSKLLLQQARRDWLTFKKRYEHLEEFASIVAGTDIAAV